MVAALIVIVGLFWFGWADLSRIHVRRIWAISSVCFAESVRRKIWLKTRSCVASAGKSCPTSAPTTMDTRIQVVRDRRRTANTTAAVMAAQRKRSGPDTPEELIRYTWSFSCRSRFSPRGSGGIGRRASLRS